MRVALAADHGGYMQKKKLMGVLSAQGYQVTDFGTDSAEPVDYPVYCFKLTDAIISGQCDRGILLCKSGIGMSVCANKVKGIYAALCSTPKEAELARRHNDSNVLVLSARFLKQKWMWKMALIWLRTPFDGGRHERRVNEIQAYEQNMWKGGIYGKQSSKAVAIARPRSLA